MSLNSPSPLEGSRHHVERCGKHPEKYFPTKMQTQVQWFFKRTPSGSKKEKITFTASPLEKKQGKRGKAISNRVTSLLGTYFTPIQ